MEREVEEWREREGGGMSERGGGMERERERGEV